MVAIGFGNLGSGALYSPVLKRGRSTGNYDSNRTFATVLPPARNGTERWRDNIYNAFQPMASKPLPFL